MRFFLRAWTVWLALVFVSMANAAPARAAECDDDATTRFPAANAAILAWEGANSTQLPNAARLSVLKEFCVAAEGMMSDPSKAIASSAIDGAIPKTINDYLDRVSQPNRDVRSIDATLRQYLGFGGLSRGKQNRFTRLAIRYTQQVDSVTVNGERLSPSPLFLVLVGTVTLDGFSGGKTVCHHEATVAAGVKLEVEC